MELVVYFFLCYFWRWWCNHLYIFYWLPSCTRPHCRHKFNDLLKFVHNESCSFAHHNITFRNQMFFPFVQCDDKIFHAVHNWCWNCCWCYCFSNKRKTINRKKIHKLMKRNVNEKYVNFYSLPVQKAVTFLMKH